METAAVAETLSSCSQLATSTCYTSHMVLNHLIRAMERARKGGVVAHSKLILSARALLNIDPCSGVNEETLAAVHALALRVLRRGSTPVQTYAIFILRRTFALAYGSPNFSFHAYAKSLALRARATCEDLQLTCHAATEHLRVRDRDLFLDAEDAIDEAMCQFHPALSATLEAWPTPRAVLRFLDQCDTLPDAEYARNLFADLLQRAGRALANADYRERDLILYFAARADPRHAESEEMNVESLRELFLVDLAPWAQDGARCALCGREARSRLCEVLTNSDQSNEFGESATHVKNTNAFAHWDCVPRARCTSWGSSFTVVRGWLYDEQYCARFLTLHDLRASLASHGRRVRWFSTIM